MPEYYTRRRRTASRGDLSSRGRLKVNTDGSGDLYFDTPSVTAAIVMEL
jgi:hypothetical protein